MPLIEVLDGPTGRRVYMHHRHVHHGLTGVLLMTIGAAALPNPLGLALVAAGVLLVGHDWSDRHCWLPDFLTGD